MILEVAAILASACFATGASDDELFRQAERARKEDRPAEALRLDPTNDWSAHRLGLLAWAREDYVRAIEWQDKAIALCPYIAEYHAALGRAYERTGEADKAKAALKRAEELRIKRP